MKMRIFVLFVSYIITALASKSVAQKLFPIDGTAICTATNDQIRPQIAEDREGGAIIVWSDRRQGLYWNIYAQRIDGNGDAIWNQDGIQVSFYNEDKIPVREPHVIGDGAGGAYISWINIRNVLKDPPDSGIIQWEIYVQRIDVNGNLLWPKSGIPILPNHAQNEMAMVSDGAGGIIISWEECRRVSKNLDIYSQKIDMNGNLVWNPNGILICNAKNEFQTELQMVNDGDGGAVIVWEDWQKGQDYPNGSDIYAQRIDKNGQVKWQSNGVPICTLDLRQSSCVITNDGQNSFIVAWDDQRYGVENTNIYAQRININGIVQWQTNGIPICWASGYQGEPAIIADDIGGAIIAWLDWRDENADIFAQRIDPNGTCQWMFNGVPICQTQGDQRPVSLLRDGHGGAIFSWEDRSSTDYIIYSQIIDNGGHLKWDNDGIRVCTNSGAQSSPRIASDGLGGAFFAWNDKRKIDNWDIYAIHLANETESFHEFTFAHITDVHIGWETTVPVQGSSNISIPPYFRTVTAYELFTDALQDIIDQNYNPDFILITGDIVESAKDNEYFFSQFKLALAHFEKNLGHEIHCYVVPGNHDRYEKSPGMDWTMFPGNEHLSQYYDSLGRPDANKIVTIFPGFQNYNPPSSTSDEGLDWYNYSFKNNGYLFIGLDSGSDYRVNSNDIDPTPEGNGLHHDQIIALHDFDETLPKICFMHHPIYTGVKDFVSGWENESIVNNRELFITYCQGNNVRLVLSGHTHRNFEHDNAGTAYVQTPSVTKDNKEYPRGYRLIKVENEDTVTPLPYRKTPVKKKYVEYAAGPVYLSATDSQGRYTGFGSIIVDIPDSYYTGYKDDSTMQAIILYDTGENYQFQVVGADTGFADIGLIGDDLIVKMQDLSVTTATIDKMHFQEDSTFVYTTNDQEKDFSISLAREFEDRNRVFIVSNSSISNTDSAKFQIIDKHSLRYTNIGSPKTYKLCLMQMGVDSGSFEYANIAIGENENQLITPANWNNLNSSSINLEVDRGNDGSIDSTIILGNATSVRPETMQEDLQDFKLFHVFPNPSNSEVTIQYNLPHPENVFLGIYNIRGELVRILFSEKCAAGIHTIKWNGKDGQGRELGSGVYFYRLTAGHSGLTRKILKIK